jgi:hypothetical protein
MSSPGLAAASIVPQRVLCEKVCLSFAFIPKIFKSGRFFLGYCILGDHLIYASIHWFISHGCLFHEIASTHQSVLSLLFEEGWLPVICFL